MKNKLLQLKDRISGKFKEFPVTFLLLWVGFPLCFVFQGVPIFLTVLIPFALNFENLGLKLKHKVLGLIGSTIIGVFYTYVLSFGYSYNKFDILLTNMIIAELLIFGLIYIYISFKKQKNKSFLEYARDSLFNLLEIVFKYIVLACGIYIIGSVICSLFADLYWYEDTILLFPQYLLGGLYFIPNAIMAFQNNKKDNNDLIKVLFTDILSILLYISFLVIYAYILYMVVLQFFPEAQTFFVVSLLFVVGVCIWSVNSTIENNAIWNKYIKYLPYAFIPLIILQILCLYLRISEFGLTFPRYFGILMVVFEIIYEVFYIFKFKLEYLLYVLMVLSFISLVCPGINMYDVTYYSQYRRLYKVYHKENKTEDDYQKIVNVCDDFGCTDGYYSDPFTSYLSTKFKPEEYDDFLNIYFDHRYVEHEYRNGLSWFTDIDFLDVSKYSNIYIIDANSNYASNDIIKEYDLTGMFKYCIDIGEENLNNSNNLYELDDIADFLITKVEFFYDDDHNIGYYSFQGYLLVE